MQKQAYTTKQQKKGKKRIQIILKHQVLTKNYKVIIFAHDVIQNRYFQKETRMKKKKKWKNKKKIVYQF